jgi:transposase InsO family protein
MDMFVVPTISFRLLYGLLIMGHGRRHILWFGVTADPTAEWIANQVTEACGWEQAPRYLIRDRDGAYGEVFIRRIRSIGIRDRPTSPRSPWQNGCAERLIGSIRRECLDHVIVFSERHLRHLLLCYMKYYNRASEHPSGYVFDKLLADDAALGFRKPRDGLLLPLQPQTAPPLP